ncbi:MAG: CPBP family intramembrane glutamic endopeptidase [Chitinophagaceae bacterium]
MNQHIHFSGAFKNLETQIRQAEIQATELEKHVLAMKNPGELVLMVIIMGVIPGFVEEIFFRGVMQRVFIEITGRPWVGIIITAVIFSAVHGQFLGFFPRAMLGVILGALFWFSGSIWPNILAHVIFNGVQIILVYYNPKFADGNPNFSSAVLGLSAIAVTAIFWWMVKSSQTTYEEIYDTDDDFMIGRKDQYTS